jgi:hypothetical protein
VLLPEVIKTTWWQFLLHTHRARRLHAKLLRFGGSNVVVISMPRYFEEPDKEQGVAAAVDPGEVASVVEELRAAPERATQDVDFTYHRCRADNSRQDPG